MHFQIYPDISQALIWSNFQDDNCFGFMKIGTKLFGINQQVPGFPKTGKYSAKPGSHSYLYNNIKTTKHDKSGDLHPKLILL